MELDRKDSNGPTEKVTIALSAFVLFINGPLRGVAI